MFYCLYECFDYECWYKFKDICIIVVFYIKIFSNKGLLFVWNICVFYYNYIFIVIKLELLLYDLLVLRVLLYICLFISWEYTCVIYSENIDYKNIKYLIY